MRIVDGPLLPALLVAIALGAAMVPASVREQLGRRGDMDVERVEMLGELEVGTEVAGWTVRGLRVDQGERVHVALARGELSCGVMLAPHGSEPFRAALSTRTRDLFFQETERAPSVPHADREEVLRALAELVRAHEGVL